MIKTGGEWISSLEIEDMISQHPAVSEVAVIGITRREVGRAPACAGGPKTRQQRHT